MDSWSHHPRNYEGMRSQITALPLIVSWRKSPNPFWNTSQLYQEHTCHFFPLHFIFSKASPLHQNFSNAVLYPFEHFDMSKHEFPKENLARTPCIFDRHIFSYLDDIKHMLIQLVRGKMIFQQLLISSVLQCDESFKLLELESSK